MTAQPTEADAPAPAEPAAPPIAKPEFIINVEPNSRLEALLAEIDDAKAAEKAAKEHAETVVKGIKVELAKLAPAGETRLRVTSPYLAKPLRMTATEGSWTLDTDRMKKEAPLLYVEFAKQGKPGWKLEAVRGA